MLVSQGFHNRTPQTRQLKLQKFVSQFCGPEVQDEGAGRADFWGFSPRLADSSLLTVSPLAFSLHVFILHVSSFYTPVYWIRALTTSLRLHYLFKGLIAASHMGVGPSICECCRRRNLVHNTTLFTLSLNPHHSFYVNANIGDILCYRAEKYLTQG